MPLSTNGRIELAFDRYLVPYTVTRQTFPLHDLLMRPQTPVVAYDPVARVVTIQPAPAALEADQTYVINIDPKGLRSIDGATIDPRDAIIEFPVIAIDGGTDAGPAPPALPMVDFCLDIQPLFASKCTRSSCHGPINPAAGLRLDSPTALFATAVGRVAHGANVGSRASPRPPQQLFGVDMPIVDPGSGGGGNPGNSWLLYKMLLAVPSPSAMASAGCDGGPVTPTDLSSLHLVEQPAFTDPAHDSARAVLSDKVLGREMPFPNDPGDSSIAASSSSAPLTIDELERVSRWIAQPLPEGGALVPAACACEK
jgi:hypothetical protein